MAQLAVGIAGGLGASAIGQPFGLGYMAATLIWRILNPEVVEGPRVEQFDVPTSTLGEVIPKGYGTFRVTGHIFDVSDVTEVAEDERGKGTVYRTYTYYQDLAIAIVGRPMAAVLKIWADKELIYDNTAGVDYDNPPTTSTEFFNAKLPKAEEETSFQASFYYGSESQEPDPTLEEIHGVGEVPAHRGLTYVVFKQFDLTAFGNRIPVFEFLVTESVTDYWFGQTLTRPSPWTGQVAWLTYDPYRPFIYALMENGSGEGDHGLVKVDRVTGEFISYRDNPWADFSPDALGNPLNDQLESHHGAVDRQGYLWLHASPPGGATVDRVLYRIDPNTLLPTFEPSQQPSSTFGNGPRAGVIFRLYDLPGRQMLGAAYSTNVPPTLVNVYQLDRAVNGSVYLGEIVDDGNSPSSDFWGVQFDYEGRLWTITGTAAQQWKISGATEYAQGTFQKLQEVDLSSISTSWRKINYWVNGRQMVCISADSKIATIDVDTGAVTDHSANTGWVSSVGSGQAYHTFDSHWILTDRVALGGTLTGGVDMWIYNLRSESDEYEIRWTTVDDAPGADISQTFYDPLTSSVWMGSRIGDSEWGRILLPYGNPGYTTLRAICEALAADVGYDAADYDFTALTDVVRGYKLYQSMSARAAIETLQAYFRFDIIESDWQLKGVKRDGASVATIPQDDLGADASGKPKENFLEQRILQEHELPKTLEWRYIDQNRDYQQDIVRAMRFSNVTASTNKLVIDTAVVLTNKEAQEGVWQILSAIWNERSEFAFAVSAEYLYLDPVDVVTVQKGSDSFEIRLTEVGIGTDWTLTLKGVKHDTYYDSVTKAAITDNGFTPDTIPYLAQTMLILGDWPLLQQGQNTPGFYLAAAKLTPSGDWSGTNIERSQDGVSYVPYDSATKEVTYGYTLTSIPSGLDYTVIDRSTTVRVAISNGKTLSSVTEAQMRDGSNLAVLRRTTGEDWIFSFANATLVADGIYDLDTIIWGWQGTEGYVADGLGSGALFVLLDDTKIQTQDQDITQNGVEFYYRARTIGQSNLLLATTYEFTNNNVRLKPYEPFKIEATWGSPGAGDVTITWERRSRISAANGLWRTSIWEDSEDYKVEIYDGSTLVRTITTTASANGSVVTAASRQAVYDAADMASDFTPTPTEGTLSIKVFQVSGSVGDGRKRSATV